MTTSYQVYRLIEDGHEQSLGYYVSEDEAYRMFDYYSEVRYPNTYVDIREIN
jgi:hypothetical protein